MHRVEFEITFHSPFRVSTGYARPGLDASIDMDNPLPSSSLKGLMRATAKQLLGENAAVIDEVFGSREKESPWRWKDATPQQGTWHDPKPSARVGIDPETHSSAEDMLGISEQTGAERAQFSISQRYRLDPDVCQRHQTVLAIAGQATRSLGANRRRGMGWVTITCTNVELDKTAVEQFLELGAA